MATRLDARNIRQLTAGNLQRDRKLVLLVNLNGTLCDCTNDPNAQWINGVEPLSNFFARVRPGAEDFLRQVSKLYEVVVCTRSNAECAFDLARMLDWEQKIFKYRGFSRDEIRNPDARNREEVLAHFPARDMVVVMDHDRDAWPHTNILIAKPYKIFLNNREAADEEDIEKAKRSGTSIRIADNDRSYLSTMADRLIKLHQVCYEESPGRCRPERVHTKLANWKRNLIREAVPPCERVDPPLLTYVLYRVNNLNRPRLERRKKLIMLVDIDNTLVQTTTDPLARILGGEVTKLVHGDKHVRVRPGVRQFLEDFSDRYEIVPCSMHGDMFYACEVSHLLDPEQKIFKMRQFCKEDLEGAGSKEKLLRHFAPDIDDMIIPVDYDIEAWPTKPYVNVPEYEYFHSDKQAFNDELKSILMRNPDHASLPKEDDDDIISGYLTNFMTKLHQICYGKDGQGKARPEKITKKLRDLWGKSDTSSRAIMPPPEASSSTPSPSAPFSAFKVPEVPPRRPSRGNPYGPTTASTSTKRKGRHYDDDDDDEDVPAARSKKPREGDGGFWWKE